MTGGGITSGDGLRVWLLHLALIAALALAPALLPDYHVTNLSRIMVLAIFAMGYNLAFGYCGLLSLGHALFFAAGVYGAALPVTLWGWSFGPALIAGLLAGGLVAGAVGLLALRTAGVSFMIVTLMFAQAGYLGVLYFGAVTGGDEGLVVARKGQVLLGLDLASDGVRYGVVLALFAVALLICLAIVRAPFGRVMVGLRENEERSRMLGYDPFRTKLIVLIISGLYAGVAGAAQALLFSYAGATFATIQYSILPLLYVLLGGAGVVMGPLLGAILMFALVEVASGFTDAHMLVTGAALVVLVLFAPKGLLGSLRDRLGNGGPRWLP